MASFPRRLHAIQGNFYMFLLNLVKLELCFIRQMGPELAVATEANNEKLTERTQTCAGGGEMPRLPSPR